MTEAHPIVSDPRKLMELIHNSIISYEGLQAQWRRALTINAHERLALAHLYESGSMTMSELGERIPLSRAAVTSLTDRLEALGYVKRTPDENDRRRTMLSLTPVPEQKVAPIAKSFALDMVGMSSEFSADEFEAVVRFLNGLRAVSHKNSKLLRDLSDVELAARVGPSGPGAPMPS